MDRQIKELMKQGLSRHEIFEQLKKQSGNQMRLANKIATFEPGSSSRQTALLNRVLMALCLLQACFGIWVIHSNVVPMDEEFGWQGIVATFILTIFYFVGLFKKSFTGYASFILLCITVAAGYVYFFNYFPVVSIVGVLLAVAGGALSYTNKVRLFPHMGFMDVRKDESGEYIFEESKLYSPSYDQARPVAKCNSCSNLYAWFAATNSGGHHGNCNSNR